MHFHAEHVDADGVLSSTVHHIPSNENESPSAVRKECARLLAHLAQKKKWTQVKLWDAHFPQSERMKRINHIRSVNGEPPRFSAGQIANADKPQQQIQIAQFDKDGKPVPSLSVPPLGLTQIREIEDGSPVSTDITAVQDMGMGDAVTPESLAGPSTVDAAALTPDSDAAKPDPIASR